MSDTAGSVTVERAAGEAPAGSRRATRSSQELLVGVDVGGSSIGVLITDTDGHRLADHSVPTVRNEPGQAAWQIADAVLGACAAAGLDPQCIVAVGVGVPGRVEPHAGVVSLALNLGWENVPLRAQLEALLGAPASVANDVRAAAAGLVARRVLGDVDDLVYVSIGTGISAGVVVDGRLTAGRHQMAGEIGHVVVDERGPECPCGLRGCLETYAGGRFIAERAAAAVAQREPSSLAHIPPGRPISTADVYAAADDGDPLAVRLVDEAGRALARVLYHLALTLDVERICIGGGVSAAGPAFERPIRSELDRLRGASALAREVLSDDLVQLLPPGSDAGTWGALTLARDGWTQRSVPGSARKEVGDRSVSALAT
jgi:glucokinase